MVDNLRAELEKRGVDVDKVVEDIKLRSSEMAWMQTNRMCQIRKYVRCQYKVDDKEMSDAEVRAYLKKREKGLDLLLKIVN